MNKESTIKENSFRSILKGTFIFGGVQVFNILISAVRLKFVAILLGPAGMGVAGLFNSISLTLQQISSVGLNLAVVKETGAAKNNRQRLTELLSTLRPLVLVLGLAGALICIFFSGTLSDITFGNSRYRHSFLILSAAVFFSVLGGALMSVLQGLHEVKRLSKASLIGSLVGLFVGVPLYWLWGTDGIVPAMVALSLSTCLWYYISLRKSLTVATTPWKREIHLPILRRIMTMGLILMSNELFKSLVNYLINVYVRSAGGIDDVGFYQSCNTMTSQYSAVIFTAMAMDYLPRLSSAAENNREMCSVVNRQMEVVGLLFSPLVCAVIFLAPRVIQLLQTSEFLVAVPLLRLLALAVMVRGLMYPLGYIIFAKDNTRLFFWMESFGANILTLSLTVAGYSLFGLNGLGLAAMADCLICLVVYMMVNRNLYGYRLSRRAAWISAAALLCAAAMAAVCFCLDGLPMILAAGTMLAVTSVFSGRALIRLWKRTKTDNPNTPIP